MPELLFDFIAAVGAESLESFEVALGDFKRRREVRGDGEVSNGFLVKTVRPIAVAVGERLASKTKIRLAWLKRLARDEKAAVRCMACIVLGEIGRAAPELIVAPAHRLAADGRWEVRECLANALDDQMGPEQGEFVYNLMCRWVADPSPNVRRAPTNALMRYGIRQPRKVIALMDKLRRDDSEYVRKNVKFCLRQIARERHPTLGAGNPDNPDVMLAALAEWAEDGHTYSRWIVAGALGGSWARDRVPQAIAILRALAADDDKLVRGAVAAALRELSRFQAEAVAAAARQWAEDEDRNVQRTGALALKKLQ